jgi:hypothetical protein
MNEDSGPVAVWLARDGNLLATAQRFVEQAPAGVTASELEVVLHVEVIQTLLQLYQRKRLERRGVEGVFVYFAREWRRQREQRWQRQSRSAVTEIAESAVAAERSPERKAAMLLFSGLLDEPQRRWYAGLESLQLGHGGDRQLADLFDRAPHTVARGRKQLLAQDVEHRLFSEIQNWAAEPRHGPRPVLSSGTFSAANTRKFPIDEMRAHLPVQLSAAATRGSEFWSLG